MAVTQYRSQLGERLREEGYSLTGRLADKPELLAPLKSQLRTAMSRPDAQAILLNYDRARFEVYEKPFKLAELDSYPGPAGGDPRLVGEDALDEVVDQVRDGEHAAMLLFFEEGPERLARQMPRTVNGREYFTYRVDKEALLR